MKLGEKKQINRIISLVLCFFMVWFSAVPVGAEGFLPESEYCEGDNSSEAAEGRVTTDSSITGSGIRMLELVYDKFQGSGTESSPYMISSEEDLRNLAAEINNDSKKYEAKFFEIEEGKDIVLSDEWIPIGTEENPFLGNFNGNNRIIKNVNITSSSAIKYQGLFGYSKGTISNLHVTGKIETDSDYAGGIAGYAEGEILNCTFGMDGKSIVVGKDYVGGIAGYSSVSQIGTKDFSNSLKNNGKIKGKKNVGGIFGCSSGSNGIINMRLENTGDVEGTENTGGIVGYSINEINFSDLSSVSNEGSISGISKVGGIGGNLEGINLKSARISNNGKVTAVKDAGGIAGYSSLFSINQDSEVINSGNIEIQECNAGGIIGYIWNPFTAGDSNIENKGNITANGSDAGGIIGSTTNDMFIKSKVKISNEGNIRALSNAGGILGYGDNVNESLNIIGGEIVNSGSIYAENSNAGGIAGLASVITIGSDSKIYNEGTVTAAFNAGGISGSLSESLTAENSAVVINEGNINAEENNAGGIIGVVGSVIFRLGSKVANRGSVEAIGDNVGGISGESYSINVVGTAEAENNGSIKGKNNAGGISGLCKNNINVIQGYLINDAVVAASDKNAGGIVGKGMVSDSKTFTVNKSASIGEKVFASENAGGIVGYIEGKAEVSDSYNTAIVPEGDSFGGIIGSSSTADISIIDSFSYIKEGHIIKNIPLTKVDAKIKNSYYLVDNGFVIDNNSSAKTTDEFKYGKLAYMLDREESGKRKNLWGQKIGIDEIPVHHDGSNLHPMAYKNELQENKNLEGIMVDFDIEADSIYRVYDNCIYLNRGNQIKIKAVGLNEDQMLVFSPPGMVRLIKKEYILTGSERDVQLTYVTGVRIAGDTDWYNNIEKTFEIGTEAQLIGMMELVYGGIDFEGITITLTDDIDVASIVWNPIGTEEIPFRGTFEARKKSKDGSPEYASISNFNYISGDVNFGVFGYVEGAAIKNLKVSGSVTGIGNLAGIAANSKNSSFTNCVNNVNINGTAVVGGIAAVSENSKYEECVNVAHIYSSDISGKAGGISGTDDSGEFVECRNAGFVQSAGGAGGISSEIWREGRLKNCLNEGTVEGKNYTGGIVGNTTIAGMGKIRLTECYNSAKGTVKGSGIYAGGVIGLAGGITVLRGCFNDGSVDSRAENAGGVAGSLYSGATVEGCYNSNTGIVKNKGKYTAGVFGAIGINTKFEGIYNAGQVSGDGDYTAGVFAYGPSGMYDNVKMCYNTGEVEGSGMFVAGVCAYLLGEKKYSSNRTSYLYQCYNTGTIAGTGPNTVAAGITGTNYIDSSGGIGSYVVDCYNIGKISAADPFNIGAITGVNGEGNGNSYYWEGSVELPEGVKITDYNYATPLDKYAFESGKAAYLLDDGGTPVRKNIWGQGEKYPEPSSNQANPIYKMTLKATGPVEGFEDEEAGRNKIGYNKFELPRDGIIEIYTSAGKEAKITYSTKTGYSLNTILPAEKKVDINIDEEEKVIKLNLTDRTDLQIDINFIKLPDNLSEFYTITFDGNGGYWKDGVTQMPVPVKGGSRAVEPEAPSNNSIHDVKQRITGWYKDKECMIPYDFTAVVISDMTLYAGWETVTQHRVILDANGGSFGKDDITERVVLTDEGESVEITENPVRDKYEFAGWFIDSECLYAYDLSSAIVSEIKLYAGWIEEGKWRIVFDGNGGEVKSGDEYVKAVAISINKGDKLKEIEVKRDKKGTSTFDFAGWYTENGREWDFHDVVEGNMILKASWKENFFQEKGVYEIDSLEALETFRDMVNEGETYQGSIFILTSDIKLPRNWVSIAAGHTPSSGNWDIGFRGEFDGGGHTITLDNYQTNPVFGLLGYEGVITNLNIKGNHVYNISVPLVASSHGEVSDINVSGSFYRCVSGVVLEAFTGTIRNCKIGRDSVIDGDGAVAGILSLSRSQGQDGPVSIEGCTVEPGVTITASSGDSVVQALGGIVAYGMGVIRDCTNGAELRANYTRSQEPRIVGGIAGRVNYFGNNIIIGCVSTGNITSTGGTIGGIAGTQDTDVDGTNKDVEIKNCYSTGNIRSTGRVDYLGGIGGNVSIISDSYWYGEYLDVPEGSNMAGAITGNGSTSVKNCYYGVKDSASYESKMFISDKSDGKGSEKRTAEEFKIGMVAYLIDGADKAHNNDWTQDFDKGHPVLGKPSMYMITIKRSTGPGYIEINNRNDVAFWGNGNTVTINSFPDESTETHEYKLDKILVYDADGNQVDCSPEELEFKMPAKNVTVEAEFVAVEKPVTPPEDKEPDLPAKPDKPDKPDNNDDITPPDSTKNTEVVEGGIDDGDGIGDGTGAGIGEGTGGGTDLNGDGSQGNFSGQGTGTPVKDSSKSKSDNSAVKSPEQPENKESVVSEMKPEDKQAPPEPEKKEPDKEEESDVFKTLQDNIKEKPSVLLLIVLAVLLVNIIIAFIRFKKLKK